MKQRVQDSRFLIGIDLGTTNIALSYVDRMSKKPEELHLFRVPQIVAFGEVHERPSLPSFYYLPPDHELEAGGLKLPWERKENGVAGVHAREHGASLPERFISSAKSWLAHTGVARTDPILPWGSKLNDDKISPVQVSQFYLCHLADAWNSKFAKIKDADGSPCLFRDQQVVLTVPASFDEVARELTVEAARKAGIKHLTLLEEPMAAFYSWLAKNRDWEKKITEGETVLIVDIGGGTTDFSLISVEKNSVLRRTAVGNHLLLGGDNIDMTLARSLERDWKKTIGPREWGVLCQQCRNSKEKLLSDSSIDETTVSLHMGGSSIIGSTLTGTLKRENILNLIMEGFYPHIEANSAPPEKKGGLRDMGLPYERDPAVTKHLLNFLKQANFGEDHNKKPLIPDTILFNGGSMVPDIIRNRILEVVNNWAGDKTVRELNAWDLDLAVSVGAAYHALVKSGAGVKVQGGTARAYYLEVQSGDASKLICIMPRDTEEGENRILTSQTFKVKTNEQVRFPISSSAGRLHDKLGDVIEERMEITELPPLKTVIQFGKKESRSVDVRLSTLLNETGTLEIWLNSVNTDHRWQLKFDLRALHNKRGEGHAPSGVNDDVKVTVTEKQLGNAKEIINAAFSSKEKLPTLIKELESCFELKRDKWSIVLIRQIFDLLLSIKELRLKGADYESRWMNLAGYTLRPGFGDSSDSWRVKQIWPLWFDGPKFRQNGQVSAEWWVMWRRISGGLKKGHQDQLGSLLAKRLSPKKKKRSGTIKTQEQREMWRCLGSLELMPVQLKLKIAEYIFQTVDKLSNFHVWTLGRLGARNLVYGTADLVTPADQTSKWIEQIMERSKNGNDSCHFALGHIAGYSGDKTLDFLEEDRIKIEEYLQENNAPKNLIKGLRKKVSASADEAEQLLGDKLPIGLHLEG